MTRPLVALLLLSATSWMWGAETVATVEPAVPPVSPVEAAPSVAPVPPLLAGARELLAQITPGNTTYTHKTPVVRWGAEGSPAVCHTDCSGLLMSLLTRTNPVWDAASFKRNFGSTRPTARRFHDGIMAGKGFMAVGKITEVRPGDVIAIKFPPGGDSTGHVMIVAEAPRKVAPTKPVVPETEQWLVTILDETTSGHGPADTRRNPDKTFRGGLGQGVFRFYTGPDGVPCGYAWSALPGSAFQSGAERKIAIGRLDATYKP